MDDIGAKAVTVLRSFMTEMNVWEVKHYPLVISGDPSRFADARHDLLPIYDRHVVPREQKMGRLGVGPSLGEPPEFDPDRETIEQISVTPRKVVITTQQQTGFKLACRYTMILRGERWLLNRKEEYRNSMCKWVKSLL